MKLPTLTLHKAQIDRLEAQTSYSIYDDHPENAKFPYVTMGEITARAWCDKFEDGMEVYSTIHIWSRYHGRKEAEEMSDNILQALTSSSLYLGPNFRAALDGLDSFNLIIDLDGITRHGILTIKYLVEQLGMPFEIDDLGNLMPAAIDFLSSMASFNIGLHESLMPTLLTTIQDEHIELDSNDNIMPRST